MPKPRILMVITNLTFGGAQRVFVDQSRLLAEGYDVAEAVFNLADGNAYAHSTAVIDLGVQGGGNVLAKLKHFRERVLRLGAVKQRIEPAVCISHLEGADYVNVLSKRGEKVVLCIHGSKLYDGNIKGVLGFIRKRFLIPWLYNRADCIVTVSSAIGSELVSLGVRQTLIRPIYNFFDPVAIRERSLESISLQESTIFAGPPVLVTSGRLTVQKNQRALITLFASLLKRRDVRLLILGDGELRDNLVQQSRALGLRTFDASEERTLDDDYDVFFLGYQDNPFRLQRHAKVFVLSSAWEGFPMAIGEAMACGLPIVSSDCPTGPREFIAPEANGKEHLSERSAECRPFGILLPIPDAQNLPTIVEWVDTLDRLLSDEEEQTELSAQALARSQDFTRERIGRQWFALIEELNAPGSIASA